MNSKLGALGQTRISDKTNNDKMANMVRIEATKNLTRDHLMCMIMRALKVRGIENKPGQRATITGQEKTTHPEWLDSVIQSAAEVNVSLTAGGRHVELTDEDWPEARLPENEQNWEEGRHFYSDIITKDEGQWSNILTKQKIQHLSPDYAHVLRHEQAYLHPRTNEIIEILGRWNNTLLEARVWTREKTGKLTTNEKIFLSPLTLSNGMGCNHTITYKELFNSEETTRITLSSDKVKNLITTRRIINILKQNPPIIHINKNRIWKQLEPYKDILSNSQIFTDGSWTDMSNNIDTLFSKETVNSKTSSAIVNIAKNESWKEQPVISINITPQSSDLQKQITKSFTAELIAILGGMQISNQYKMTQISPLIAKVQQNY
jgi:hypothetical protein